MPHLRFIEQLICIYGFQIAKVSLQLAFLNEFSRSWIMTANTSSAVDGLQRTKPNGPIQKL